MCVFLYNKSLHLQIMTLYFSLIMLLPLRERRYIHLRERIYLHSCLSIVLKSSAVYRVKYTLNINCVSNCFNVHDIVWRRNRTMASEAGI